jgi:ribonuclease BN (tRNA processing enzyme)
MRLFVCGVRGSTPSPGIEFVRYGGQTSCVAIAADDEELPRLVLDAGTGLTRLARVYNGRPFRGTILLSHLHWDHTHGLPFFPAGDRPDSEVTLLLPAQGVDAEDLLGRALSPPHFPIRPSELEGKWRFASLDTGVARLEGFDVLALEIPHKGGRTYGFRVTDPSGASVAYLSDHGPLAVGPGPAGLGEYHEAARALADGVDILIHDAQHTASELPTYAHFGHSAIDYAVGLAEVCGAKQLLLFHHAPPRTDDQLDAIMAGLPVHSVTVSAAAEGTVIDVRPRLNQAAV